MLINAQRASVNISQKYIKFLIYENHATIEQERKIIQ